MVDASYEGFVTKILPRQIVPRRRSLPGGDDIGSIRIVLCELSHCIGDVADTVNNAWPKASNVSSGIKSKVAIQNRGTHVRHGRGPQYCKGRSRTEVDCLSVDTHKAESEDQYRT